MLRRLTGIRELPMMEQVEDFSLESVLAIIFHYYYRADRRVEVVQRVENISVFRDTRLPSDVASCLALSFGPIRWSARNHRLIIPVCGKL